jgi:IS5 family transposase
MFKKGDASGSFFGDWLYEQVLGDRPHLLRDLIRLVDFEFVNETCAPFYPEETGRPPYEPALMFKIVLLQFLYRLSDRQVEEAVTYNLLYKWFLGLAADEQPPDHTALCRFRARLGPEQFLALFNHVVAAARQQGLISDELHVLDSTDMAARVDLFRLKDTCQEDDEDQTYVDRHSPDPDARFGRKTPTKGFYGYKLHLAEDATSQLITAVHITPGNAPDGAQVPALVTGRPTEVVADKGYDWPQNHHWLRRHRIISGIIRKQPGRGRPRRSRRLRPMVERKFAELTVHHGLAQCRYWGLAKTTIQAVMTAFVVNCKRLVRLLSPVGSTAA